MKKIKKINILKVLLLIITICFAIPSIIYIAKNKTLLNFDGNLEFCYLLTNSMDRLYQTIIYAVLIIPFIILYYYLIKKREELFKNIKNVYKLIFSISALFLLIIPFESSDVFYYLGIGRLQEQYHQNPYYVDMKSYIDSNNIDMSNDTVIQKGYKNNWSGTTSVYGALWTFICSIIAFLSFGNIDLGVLIFKIVNLIIHMANCYLLFKLSKKKIFTLIYGLNPFVLVEGIANAHSEVFIVFFMLLAIYMAVKKRNIILSLLFLALATDIKYFSILLLPLIVLYYYKDKDVKNRIIKCIECGGLFVIFAFIPYMFYIKDINVFMGLIEQRDRIAKGLYLVISECFKNSSNLIDIVKKTTLYAFSIIYIIKCFTILFNKDIKFYKEMRELFLFIVAFIFLLITNFQPWYLMWLTPFMIWQKAENIKLINQMQIMTLIANMVFLIYSENYKYGVGFFTILVIGILICIIKNKKKSIIKRKVKI